MSTTSGGFSIWFLELKPPLTPKASKAPFPPDVKAAAL